MLDDVEGRKVVLVFTDGDDTASRRGMGDVLDNAREQGSDDLRHRAASPSSSTASACSARGRTAACRKLSEETGGGYFELKKTDELAPTFTRVVQELHSLYTIGFNPADARRQGAQARGADEAAGHDRARAQELHRLGRTRSSERQVTEQEFRLQRRPGARGPAAATLLPLADEDGLEIDLQNGVLQIVFEEPEPAKFVVSPNAPVRQIWVSARSRSYKLAWSDDAGTFVLDGEQLGTLVERLAQEQLTGN